MDRFCPKCGCGVKQEFWKNKTYYRCIGNTDHFFSEETLDRVREEIDMTLGMEEK